MASKPQSPETSFLTCSLRGASLKCPNCGKGKLFVKYLKLKQSCEVCNQNFSHLRADDAPPYLTIFLVAHIVVPLFLFIDRLYTLSLLTLLAISIPTTIVILLLFMPSVKGAVVGILYELERDKKVHPTNKIQKIEREKE